MSAAPLVCPYAHSHPAEVARFPPGTGVDLRRVFRNAHDYKCRHGYADPGNPYRCRACGARLVAKEAP